MVNRQRPVNSQGCRGFGIVYVSSFFANEKIGLNICFYITGEPYFIHDPLSVLFSHFYYVSCIRICDTLIRHLPSQ